MIYTYNTPRRGGSRCQRIAGWWRLAQAPLRLVVINAVVFLLLKVVMLAIYYSTPGPAAIVASAAPLRWVELPGSPLALAMRPWSLLTYMFVQHDVMHLLVNMLWLYMFGSLLMTCCTGRQLIGVYLLGGLGGALLFEGAATMLHPVGLVGSSASVVAIVLAVIVMMPHMRVRLMLFGEVRILWVGIVSLVLLGYSGMADLAMQAAHLGGALAGLTFALMLRRGRDITAPVNAVGDRVVNMLRGIPAMFNRPRHAKRRTQAQGEQSTHTRRPDPDDIQDILDKVKRSGYAALTPEERARLFGRGR